jgi:hypothetical protein
MTKNFTRNWTRTGLLVALVCTGGMLSACGTQAAAAGDSAPATTPPGAAAPAAAAPSGTAPAPAQPAGAPDTATPPCRRPGVVVSAGGQGAGSGHRGVVLVFTNTGARACRLVGYPGVAGLDAAGSQVAQARRTPSGYLGGLLSGGAPPVVTLAAGQSASAMVEALAFNAPDGSACTAFAGMLVTVPDDTVTTRLPWGNDGCGDLQVHPVVAGSTGRSS